MSADLFEAFVGSQSATTDPRTAVKSKSLSPLVQPDIIANPADTWQPWPTSKVATTKSFPEQHSESLWKTGDDGKDVLFDASDLDDSHEPLKGSEDDFGDFEEATSKGEDENVVQFESSSATVDLLDLDLDDIVVETNPVAQDTIQSEVSRIANKQNLEAHGLTPPLEGQASMLVTDLEDDWGDFETTQNAGPSTDDARSREIARFSSPATSNGTAAIKSKGVKSIAGGPRDIQHLPTEGEFEDNEPWDDLDNNIGEKNMSPSASAAQLSAKESVEPTRPTHSVQRDRPTNVPPPAVLLAWLPKVFSELAKHARQSGPSSEIGITAVQAYRVSARVIAGRSARWKRDTILAQSMRIGAAGRSGGMKLMALDKGESRKEEQAAEDTIASWTRFSHVLNAAITRAKSQKPPMALSVRLIVRTATGLDVVSATHICAICGLRRNERVVGIDINISDTFGEFWTEHWGHSDCADLWYRFNELLGQR